MIEIKNRFTGKIIFKSKRKTLKEVIELKVKQGAYLGGAYLEGAYLGGADLGGAYLRGADLRVKHPPVNSHQFISEVLSRNSETEAQWDFSARIRLQTDQCWGFFIKLARKKRVLKWAKEILFQWDEFKEKLEDKLDG